MQEQNSIYSDDHAAAMARFRQHMRVQLAKYAAGLRSSRGQDVSDEVPPPTAPAEQVQHAFATL